MRFWPLFIGIMLAGCGSQTQYIRADGQYVSPQQLESARAECASSDDRFCMVGKGYFLVREGDAASKSAQLAAIVDEQKLLEEKRRQDKLAAQAAQRAKNAALAKKKRKKPTTVLRN